MFESTDQDNRYMENRGGGGGGEWQPAAYQELGVRCVKTHARCNSVKVRKVAGNPQVV